MTRICLVALLLVTGAAARSNAQTCSTPPANLQSWLPGDGSAADLIGPNDGVPMNGAAFAAGHVSQAFSLDGVDDWVEVASSAALKPSAAITIEAWILLDATPPTSAGAAIVTKGVDGEVPDDWLLSVTPGRKLRPHIKRGATWHFFDCSTTLPIGVWTHVAMSYDGSALRGYVNGVLDGGQAGSGAIQTSDFTLRIGAFAPVNGTVSKAQFDGMIDEVSVYDRALSAPELAAIATAGTAGKCKPTEVPAQSRIALAALSGTLLVAGGAFARIARRKRD